MTSRLLSVAVVIAIWLIVGLAFGGIGMVVGPGVVMLVPGLLLTCCGAVVHLTALGLGWQLRWWSGGAMVALVTLLVTWALIPDTRNVHIGSFVAACYWVAGSLGYAAAGDGGHRKTSRTPHDRET